MLSVISIIYYAAFKNKIKLTGVIQKILSVEKCKNDTIIRLGRLAFTSEI